MSPSKTKLQRPIGTQTATRPATRERILRVAAELWRASSFDGVGTAEICRRAKVHKGSFFHFFPSKDDLLLAVLDRYREELAVAWRQGPFAAVGPPLDRFDRFFAYMSGVMKEQVCATGCAYGCPIGNIINELATRNATVRKAAVRVFDVMRAVFVETLDEARQRGDLPAGADTSALAATVLAFMQGFAVLGKAYADSGAMQRGAVSVSALIRAAAGAVHGASRLRGQK